MTERVIIFIIVASTLVAITLIAALMQMVKAVCEAKACKYSMVSMGMLSEMGAELGECEDAD